MITIEQRTIRVLAQQTGIAPQCIKPEHTLANDLQSDSLDCIEIMMALEEEFGIKIDQDEGEQLQTVQQVIDYVTSVCTEKELAFNKIEQQVGDVLINEIARLATMAIRVTCELDTVKNITEPLSHAEKTRIQQMVEDAHDALEAMGISYPLAEESPEDDIEYARRVAGVCTAGNA
jgi:acyl carrier protein